MNKESGGDGIPAELFQTLNDDAVKVPHSICQQTWKSQQWPQDWKRSVFIPIPKKGNVKECSHYRTTALISHASKVMLKITHYQRNANQNHNEVPFHASQTVCDPKVYKQQMLERVWRKGNPLILLVGMKTSTATMENSVEIP